MYTSIVRENQANHRRQTRGRRDCRLESASRR